MYLRYINVKKFAVSVFIIQKERKDKLRVRGFRILLSAELHITLTIIMGHPNDCAILKMEIISKILILFINLMAKALTVFLRINLIAGLKLKLHLDISFWIILIARHK